MKKKAIYTAIILLIAGMVLSLISMLIVRFDFEKLSVNAEHYEKILEAEYASGQNFTLNASREDIRIQPSEDDKIHVVCYESKQSAFSLTEDENGVTLTENKESFRWFESWTLNFKGKNYATVVKLPSVFDGELRVTATSQNMSVENLSGIKICSLESKSGNVSCSAVKAESFTVETKSGNVRCSNVGTANFSAETATGNITLEQVTTNVLNAESSTGNIRLKEITGGTIDLKTSTGNVTGSVTGKETDYTLRAETGTGNCNFANRGGGKRILDVKTSTGNVRISFLG